MALHTVVKAKFQFGDKDSGEWSQAMEVMFNPASISYANGYQTRSEPTIDGKGGKYLRQIGEHIQLVSMQLYFDLVPAYEAYLKLHPFTANLKDWGSITFKGVSASSSKDKATAKQKEMSLYLQTVTDITKIDLLQSFIGKKRNPYYWLDYASRKGHDVHFVWNTMDYVGKLNSFSSTFTYFARSGAPLRAVVNISIDVELDKNSATAQETREHEDARGEADANTAREVKQVIAQEEEDMSDVSD